jgi:hypothetical protein
MKHEYMLLSYYLGEKKFANRKAEVLRTVGEHRDFGIKMYVDNNLLGIEWFKGHNEYFAEDAAENYVQGIKNYQQLLVE